MEFQLGDRIVQLVDTPGFDDVDIPPADVLRLIGEWLMQLYVRIDLSILSGKANEEIPIDMIRGCYYMASYTFTPSTIDEWAEILF